MGLTIFFIPSPSGSDVRVSPGVAAGTQTHMVTKFAMGGTRQPTMHDGGMTHEPWADSQLSEALPQLAQAGESETVEFKRELPKQVRDLAKEIAAFASTSGGVLLVGVGDDGQILGIPNAHTPDVRDDFERRIVGVCQMIEPPVKPKITWASTGGVGVMAITVEKGSRAAALGLDARLHGRGRIAQMHRHGSSRPHSTTAEGRFGLPLSRAPECAHSRR